jgi:hypothetical protein
LKLVANFWAMAHKRHRWWPGGSPGPRDSPVDTVGKIFLILQIYLSYSMVYFLTLP